MQTMMMRLQSFPSLEYQYHCALLAYMVAAVIPASTTTKSLCCSGWWMEQEEEDDRRLERRRSPTIFSFTMKRDLRCVARVRAVAAHLLASASQIGARPALSKSTIGITTLHWADVSLEFQPSAARAQTHTHPRHANEGIPVLRKHDLNTFRLTGMEIQAI